jgi:hypothetical protein
MTFHLKAVHSYHDIEETCEYTVLLLGCTCIASYLPHPSLLLLAVFLPLVRTKQHDFDTALQDHHLQIVAFLEKLQASVTTLATATAAEQRTAALNAIRSAWPEYVTLLVHHLVEEEKMVWPIVKANFNKAEHDEMVKKILAREMKNPAFVQHMVGNT